MKLGKRLLVVLAAAAFLVSASSDVRAQSREAELKGNMIVLLGKLVTWPAGGAPTNAKPLTIGILGNDPFVDGAGVNHLKRKLGRNGTVLSFANAQAIQPCHILVVSKDENLDSALPKVQGEPVLVVTEAPGLAAKGAAINLVFDMAANIIRLEINPANAQKAGLKISQGLLRSPAVKIIR